jgi:dTDP-4-amino-4,6-dideoxygalactose transaminase
MIPYYNPQYGLKDLLKTVLCRNADEKLRQKFREITGKKYILICSSCRSALYLAYKAIGKTGTVHTSPLTCKVALMPIIAADNKISFHDVREDDWTMESKNLERDLCEDSIAIQAIHLGGFPCDMPSLKKIAEKNNLILIEDCAQGFGAIIQGTVTGSVGDISCFTLTKNLFSLGGGILATNNREWYLKAKQEQESFPKERNLKIAYRIILALLSTYRSNRACELFYQRLKRKPVNKAAKDDHDVLIKELRYPASIYAKSCVPRWDKIQRLIKQRKESAKTLLNDLGVSVGKMQFNPDSESSYTKLFILSEKHSKDVIQNLNESGIEAMHLEHKHKTYYQNNQLHLQNTPLSDSRLNNYKMIYDHILSLPIDHQYTNFICELSDCLLT